MPKSRIKPNAFDLEMLANALQEKFGVVVTDNRSLMQLLNEIQRAGYKTELGWNTWRRLFGLIRNEHSPSITTLNILSDFLGFQSWVDFLQHNSLEKERDFRHRFGHYVAGNTSVPDIKSAWTELGPSAAFYRFLQQCLIIGASHADTEVVKAIYCEEEWFPFSVEKKEAAFEEFQLHQLMGIYCFKKAIPGFAEVLCIIPAALKRVLQFCVHYGSEASSYMICFEKGYSLGLFAEESDFANSVLAYHGLLTNDDMQFSTYATSLMDYEVNPKYLLPAGRIRVIQWANAHSKTMMSDESINSVVYQDYLIFKNVAKHLDAFSFYLLYIIRYLYHNKRYALAATILQRYYPHGPSGISFWSGVIWNRLRIYIAGVYAHCDQHAEGLEQLMKVRSEWFDTFQFPIDSHDYQQIKSLYAEH